MQGRPICRAASTESQAPSANQAQGRRQQLGLGSRENREVQNPPLRAAPRLR